jgi:membrane protein DedA with SNARE-associated domain
MENLSTPFPPLNSFLQNFGYLGLFILLLLEESGIPLPVPGDVFIFIGGTQAKFGKTSFFGVVTIVFIATVLGASILYFISAKLARPLVLKLARLGKVDEEKIEKVSLWFVKRGGWAVVIGRLTPGFRTVTSIVAGLLGIPYRIFVFYTGIAALIWGIIYFNLGYFFGEEAILILQIVGRYFVAFVVIVGFLVLAGFFYWGRKKIKGVRK